MIDWNPQQSTALDAVGRWLRDSRRKPVFYLAGYAGTGKTSLAKHLATSNPGLTLFAAYTGKAALVMRRAGCTDARTIHSLIYTPFELNDAKDRIEALRLRLKSIEDPKQVDHLRKELDELERSVRSPTRPAARFILKEESDLRKASLLVVDECSMVSESVARDLMSFDVPILVLGDPAQLPPVRGEGYFTSARPDVMLTDVMRQAKDNPIIQIATAIRENGDVGLGQYGDSAVLRGRPSEADATETGQIICGKNATRKGVNAWYRKRLGRSDLLPLVGDRIICLRNDREQALLNGGMWSVEATLVDDGERFIDLSIKDDDSGRVIDAVQCHRHVFTGEETHMAPWEWRDAQEFDYAYAITAHKSQGSQWPSVTILDEWFMDTRRQWLYTAVTRAQERVTVYRR